MSEKTTKPVKPGADRPKTALGKSVSLTMGLIAAIFITVVVSIIIEVVGITFDWWPEDHAMELLEAERGFIGGVDAIPLVPFTAASVEVKASQKLDEAIGSVYQKTQARHATDKLTVYISAAINVTQLVLLRLVVILFILPGYLVVALAAAIDGGTKRDIRKFTGEHESSYVFHGAKRWIFPSIVATASIYLLLPFSVYPALVFAPSMILFGSLLYVATARFKKFL